MMAAANFLRILALILRVEGGYVDNPHDPGGATKFGITLGTLSSCRGKSCNKADVKALTEDEAGDIYRARYWSAVHGDDLPAGVDYAVFDFAVNSGPARAIMSMQRALGVADDGKLGPLTLAALQHANPRKLVNAICDDRLAMMKRLSTWNVFGKGWGRRVADVRVAALSMTDAPPPGLFARIVSALHPVA